MAAKTTLNEKNLRTLGAERLAALVMEVVTGNAALKRQARAALLENAGGDALAAEVRKRLATIKRSTSFVDWQKRPALVKDLHQQRILIADKIAPTDPATALELMWRFMELAESVHNRADDSNGDIGDVFREGCAALGHIAEAAKSEAQADRWHCFERTLSADHLRDHLKRLPDFEDVEAEERALDRVRAYPEIHKALQFLTHWPDHRRAADLVLAERGRWDGNLWYFLPDIAQALAGKHPLATTILYRALVLDTLGGAKSKRYKHAARHLTECASLANGIDDYSPLPSTRTSPHLSNATTGAKQAFGLPIRSSTPHYRHAPGDKHRLLHRAIPRILRPARRARDLLRGTTDHLIRTVMQSDGNDDDIADNQPAITHKS